MSPSLRWGLFSDCVSDMGHLVPGNTGLLAHILLRATAVPLSAGPTPTATEFFMSATAEVNSLKCSSGQ